MEQVKIVGVSKDNKYLIDSNNCCYKKMCGVESVGDSVIIEVEGLGHYVSIGKPQMQNGGDVITVKAPKLKVK